MSEDLFFDDWGAGSDLAAGATLPDVVSGGGGMDWLSIGSAALKALPALSNMAGGGKTGPTSTAASSSSAAGLSSNVNIEPVFDNSGWVVNFGAGNVETERTQRTEKTVDQDGDLDVDADADARNDQRVADDIASVWLPYVALMFGAVILWRMAKG